MGSASFEGAISRSYICHLVSVICGLHVQMRNVVDPPMVSAPIIAAASGTEQEF